jgi:Fibronectin type III domain
MTGRAQHRARRRSRYGFGLGVLFFVAGFLLAGGTAAMAFYVINVVSSGSPASVAQAAQLGAPTAPTASANDTSGTMTIAWTAGSQPTGAPVQYQVVRSSGPGSPETVCTVGSGATSCQDTGLVAGTTYGYSITAVLDTWQSASVTASATTATPTLALTLSSSSTTAGEPATVQNIAAVVDGTVDTTYTGSKTIGWSGLSNSPLGQAPSYPSGSLTFVNGVAALSGPGSSFTDFEAGSSVLTATDTAATTVTGQAPLTVQPATASSFILPTPSAQRAGTAFGESLTAVDAYGNTASGFGGAQAITFSGPTASPDGTAASYPASVSFTAGVGTASITLPDAETTTLTASQGTIAGTSGAFTVNAAGAATFALPTPSRQSAGTAFDETITAVDAYGNTAGGFGGVQAITFGGPSGSPDGTSPSYPDSVTFTDGVGTASITLFDAGNTTLTASQGTIAGASGSFPVNAAGADTFVLPTPSTQNAGTAFDETITAVDAYGNTASGWTPGARCVTISGPSASPDAATPIYPAAGGCPEGDSSLTFDASDQATASITLFDAGTTALTATAGAITGTSATFTVNPLAASSFVLSTPSAPSAGTAFDETITAVDVYGNTSTGYAGPYVLTFTGPLDGPDDTAPAYPASVSFATGVATASITLPDAGTTTLMATEGDVTGTSGSFTVAAPGGAPQGAQASAFLRSPVGRDATARLALTHLRRALAETLS